VEKEFLNEKEGASSGKSLYPFQPLKIWGEREGNRSISALASRRGIKGASRGVQGVATGIKGDVIRKG